MHKKKGTGLFAIFPPPSLCFPVCFFLWVVAAQLQGFLDGMDYLDPFQSGFRPALVILVDARNWTGGVCPCWFCWTSHRLVIPFTMIVFWTLSLGWHYFMLSLILPRGENSEDVAGRHPGPWPVKSLRVSFCLLCYLIST